MGKQQGPIDLYHLTLVPKYSSLSGVGVSCILCEPIHGGEGS
jgi:hypothetical protein